MRIFLVLIWGLIPFLTVAQRASVGWLDLRDKEDDFVIRLEGECEFYWQKLLTSETIGRATADYFTIPSIWNDRETLEGQNLTAEGYATYRLRVLLPPNFTPAIYIKHIHSSYRLYAGNILIAENGNVSADPDAFEPKWVPIVEQLPNDSDTLELIIQVANFAHRRGGIKEPILFGDKSRLEASIYQSYALDLVLAGFLVMCGMFFMGLYFYGSKEKFIMFFSIVCFAFSFQILSTDNQVLNWMFPQRNWYLAHRIEYMCLFVSVIFFLLYTDSLFSQDKPRKLLKGVILLNIANLLFITVTPLKIFTGGINVNIVLILLAIIMSGWKYISAYRNQREGSKLAGASAGIILAVFVYEIVDFKLQLDELEIITFLGYILFFICHALILFFLFTDSLKAAKVQAEKASKAKSEFLSMMSHEIRTPMNAVIGLTNFLLTEKPDPSQIETLNSLKFSAKNLLVIINDILDFSKIEARKIQFEKEPVDLRALLHSLKQVFTPEIRKRNIELRYFVDRAVPSRVICDPTRASQVLTNLISNGIKFTEAGMVSINVTHLKSTDTTTTLKFSIEDTGIGIPKEKIKEIFKGFEQVSNSSSRKFGGTGLGLAITRQLLRMQGSELHVKSSPGEGSTFYFTQIFEIEQEVPKTVINTISKAPKPKTQNIENLRVLVVEDNEMNVVVLQKFLNRWGVKTTIAKNGKEAIMEYDKGEKFDLILMDLQMPVMDGYTAAKKLRAQGATMPIIALTAALMTEKDELKSYGIDDMISKPFDPDLLKKKIRAFTADTTDVTN